MFFLYILRNGQVNPLNIINYFYAIYLFSSDISFNNETQQNYMLSFIIVWTDKERTDEAAAALKSENMPLKSRT